MSDDSSYASATVLPKVLSLDQVFNNQYENRQGFFQQAQTATLLFPAAAVKAPQAIAPAGSAQQLIGIGQYRNSFEWPWSVGMNQVFPALGEDGQTYVASPALTLTDPCNLQKLNPRFDYGFGRSQSNYTSLLDGNRFGAYRWG